MSPLLRDVKEEINNQDRSQTSEQDEASLEGRMPKARIPWNFSSEKSILGQNQDEAIASSCLTLATALSFRLFGISLNHRFVRRSSRTASQIAAKLAHVEKWRDLGYARLALDQPDWCTVLFILLYGLCKGDI